MKSRYFAGFVLALCIASCGSDKAVEPAATAPASLDDFDLITRDALFDDPDLTQGRISPDGTRVSYIAPIDGVKNIWLAPIDNISAGKAITADAARGTRQHTWANNDNNVLYLRDFGGDENYHVISVDLKTAKEIDLTPYEDTLGTLIGGSYRHPGEFLIGMNDRDPAWHDVYRVDLGTAERTLVELNDGFVNYIADYDLDVRVGTKPTEDGGMSVQKKADDGEWSEILAVGKDEVFSLQLLGFIADGKTFYIIDSIGRDTSALYAVDFDTGKRTVLAANDKADIGDVLFDNDSGEPIAYTADYLRGNWLPIGDAAVSTFEGPFKTIPGDKNITNQTRDGSKWMVLSSDPKTPAAYYVVDRAKGTATKLFDTRSKLIGQPLVDMHPVVINSRDGLDLVSYLTMPPHVEIDADFNVGQSVPMVIWVHGGPWARDSFGYNSTAQWFANRGYAVLQVNYRGSTGFGKAFLNAGAMEWAAAMHDDLVDAVDWAIGKGITEQGRVAIGGGSYGGYATLVGVTFTPEKFACGVDIVGPSNLVTLLDSIPAYWQSFFEVLVNNVGDPRTEEGQRFLRSRSPLFLADQITKPLLIGQGANDPRVTQIEADQIVSAMQKAELPVTYVLYPDEGHGFGRAVNLDSFLAISEVFLANCLGGRFEAFGDSFDGSSTTVPHGVEHIPGLAEALAGAEIVEKN
jgi:dipeptidyl aminopeptidase/acylaminoacyl peptidase